MLDRSNNDMSLQLLDESSMLEFGARFATICPDTAVIFLYGDLGAGKTTLTRGFLRGLGYEGPVKSPTYTIVEPYHLKNRSVFHFDFYRIREAEELEFIGIQDYFISQAICLIEWPDYGSGQLPQPDLSCYIEPAAKGRELRIVAHSERGMEILKRMKNEN